MKLIAVVAISVVCGFLAGWWLGPGKYRYHYRASHDILLLDASGNMVARVPQGSPLLASRQLGDSVDLGWWGFTPIYFSTMSEARFLGVIPGNEMASIMDIKLNARWPMHDQSSKPDR